MSARELNIYTVRPDGTAIWLPEIMASSLGLKWGDRIPAALYEGNEIQGLIGRRLAAETGKKGHK